MYVTVIAFALVVNNFSQIHGQFAQCWTICFRVHPARICWYSFMVMMTILILKATNFMVLLAMINFTKAYITHINNLRRLKLSWQLKVIKSFRITVVHICRNKECKMTQLVDREYFIINNTAYFPVIHTRTHILFRKCGSLDVSQPCWSSRPVMG
jgi:hypothetical protein